MKRPSISAKSDTYKSNIFHHRNNIPHVRPCSVDFLQWLWWSHHRDRLARWVCCHKVPTNDRCDMADWFINHYAPDYDAFITETNVSYPSYADRKPRVDLFLLNKHVFIGEDDYTDSPMYVNVLDLQNAIQEWHLGGYYVALYGHEFEFLETPFPSKVSSRLRFDILQRDQFRCHLCGQSSHDGVKLEVDHIHPLSDGGLTTPWNLWTLCWACNNGKSSKSIK